LKIGVGNGWLEFKQQKMEKFWMHGN